MNTTDKMDLWGKIKKLNFNSPVKKELFYMIDEYIDRIEFVKDHIGLRDFMFIAEEGTEHIFVSNFFVAIDVECEKSFSYEQNLNLFLEKCIYNRTIKALHTLLNFFENTDRILYVGVGFKGVSEIDKSQLIESYVGGNFDTREEAEYKMRKFPDWYDRFAKHPKDCHFLTVKAERYINNVLKPMENVKLQKIINNILMKTNLTTEDKNALQAMAVRIKK
ncbi:hypothetical protein AAGG74_14800 [Bacillus mexicanus]|uniref:hypothetical protein n=1 Tax=Bacillus mexicanus TaxID=2834415 RepID=UPI003D1C83B1